MGKNSKSKLLKKGKYTPEATTSAPANPEAEKKETVSKTAKNARVFVKNKAITYNELANKKKEKEDRTRMRRFNRMIAAGITEEQIKEFESNLNIRTILLMPYSSYFFVDGKKQKTITKRDEKHRVIGKETIEVDNKLTGVNAVLAFLKSNNIEPICGNTVRNNGQKPLGYVYFNTTKDKLSDIEELVKDVGRIIIHKWVPEEPEEERKQRKPSKNTKEVKIAAKKSRKAENMSKANMRPYYAAKRKGGVSSRIKKFNPELAAKIEKWLAEQQPKGLNIKKAASKPYKYSKEYRAKHRQLTSIEMKCNKRARKAAKSLATQKRRQAREKAAMVKNQADLKKRAQKAVKSGKKAVEQKLPLKEEKQELKKTA